MPIINESQLVKEAAEFLHKNFDIELNVPVVISKRMKRSFGLFRYEVNRRRNTKKPIDIRMSYEFMKHRSTDEILDVLFHECVHYALFTKGLPHRDGDATFKRTVDRLGISRTRTYKFKGYAYQYTCKDCGMQTKRRMKGYEKRYICGRCRGRFTFDGKVAVD